MQPPLRQTKAERPAFAFQSLRLIFPVWRECGRHPKWCLSRSPVRCRTQRAVRGLDSVLLQGCFINLTASNTLLSGCSDAFEQRHQQFVSDNRNFVCEKVLLTGQHLSRIGKDNMVRIGLDLYLDEELSIIRMNQCIDQSFSQSSVKISSSECW